MELWANCASVRSKRRWRWPRRSQAEPPIRQAVTLSVCAEFGDIPPYRRLPSHSASSARLKPAKPSPTAALAFTAAALHRDNATGSGVGSRLRCMEVVGLKSIARRAELPFPATAFVFRAIRWAAPSFFSIFRPPQAWCGDRLRCRIRLFRCTEVAHARRPNQTAVRLGMPGG